MLPIAKKRVYRPVYMPDFFKNDFDSFFNFDGYPSMSPAVNIREDEKNYLIEMALPGMNKKDIRIETENDTLSISSEIKEENKEDNNGYSRREFGNYSFCRSYTIPEDVIRDKISASFKDGILVVELPKSEKKSPVSRNISIS